MDKTFTTDEWRGLYRGWWKGEIVPESMSHPAKYARDLIRKIYTHAIEEGWIGEGGCVVDPFGGVALGALDAMLNGINWVGVEIEPRFVLLGNGGECNGVVETKVETVMIPKRPGYKGWYIVDPEKQHYIGLDGLTATEKIGVEFEGFSTFDEATEYMLDNFDDAEVLDNNPRTISYIEFPEVEQTYQQREEIVRSSPCGKKESHEPHHIMGNIELWTKTYSGKFSRKTGAAVLIKGDSCNLKESIENSGVDLCVSSPPFTGTSADNGWQMLGKYAQEGRLTVEQVNGDKNKLYPSWNPDRDTSYGTTEGQLAAMPDKKFDLAVASPPFLQASGGNNITATEGFLADPAFYARHSAAHAKGKGYGNSENNLGNMREMDGSFDLAISSPPYADINQSGGIEGLIRHGTGLTRGSPHFAEYGSSEGQLGRMESTDEGFDMAISSPPYAETRIEGNGDEGASGLRMPDGSYLRGKEGWEIRKQAGERYGNSENNLGNMRDLGVDLAISSPPFEAVTANRPSQQLIDSVKAGDLPHFGPAQYGDGYGTSDGNIGEDSGDDFWLAARRIVDQVYAVLRPGGHAIWVVKAFVKSGKVQDFPEQWRILCEAAGFVSVHIHHAMLTEDRGTQYDLFGNPVTKTVKRASFFRRLYESKYPENSIDYECVVCMEKPG